MTKSVIIVGAGVCGLNAAYKSQNAGFAVRVLECSTRPSGTVCTVRKAGYVIDAGTDAMTMGYEACIESLMGRAIHQFIESLVEAWRAALQMVWLRGLHQQVSHTTPFGNVLSEAYQRH